MLQKIQDVHNYIYFFVHSHKPSTGCCHINDTPHGIPCIVVLTHLMKIKIYTGNCFNFTCKYLHVSTDGSSRIIM